MDLELRGVGRSFERPGRLVEALADVSEAAALWEIPLANVGELVSGAPGVMQRSSEGLRPVTPRSHEHFATTLGMGMTPQP